MFDITVFNRQLQHHKHANKSLNYFILDNKGWGAGSVSSDETCGSDGRGGKGRGGGEGGGRLVVGDFRKNIHPNCSCSLPRSLSTAQSLKGISANLIPGSIQLKRVQRHGSGASDMIRVLCTTTLLLWFIPSLIWTLTTQGPSSLEGVETTEPRRAPKGGLQCPQGAIKKKASCTALSQSTTLSSLSLQLQKQWENAKSVVSQTRVFCWSAFWHFESFWENPPNLGPCCYLSFQSGQCKGATVPHIPPLPTPSS